MAANDVTHLDRSATRGAIVGGEESCGHPPDARTYLGHMGTAAFYQCTICSGAVITW